MGTPRRPAGRSLTVDARGLWAGGVASAAVAALAGVVGVLVVVGVLDLDPAPPPLLPVGDTLAVRYAVTAAALALLATGLAQVLVLTTPRPAAFFSWIAGLATTVGVVLPLAADGPLAGRVATALLDLVIGLCIITLVLSVLDRTTQRSLPEPWAPPVRPGDPWPGPTTAG